jgi:hypothetical protein
MRSKLTTWLHAIVLVGSLLATGCTPLWPNRPTTAGEDATDAVDSYSFRTSSSSGRHDSIFFNKQSHDIEKSLGY